MGEGVDPRSAVPPDEHFRLTAPIFDALQRIGQGGAFEASWIGQDVGNGAAGELIVIEDQLDAGEEDAIALSRDYPLATGIETPVRSTMRSACRSMKAARALAASGLSRCLSLALSSSSLAVSTIDSGGQAATVSRASPSTATGRRLSRSC